MWELLLTILNETPDNGLDGFRKRSIAAAMALVALGSGHDKPLIFNQ
jgi:hypothetical protein